MVVQSRSLKRRLAWFERGQGALRNVLPEKAGGYACPVCWRIYPEVAVYDGTLTFEHAPAGSMGGREIGLTCGDCNHTAGAKLESHALARERLIDFTQGTLDGALAVTVHQGGLRVNAQVQSTGRNVMVATDPKWNPPGTTQAWAEYLKQQREDGSGVGPPFKMTFRVLWDERASHLAYLRWAYLVAFSLLGYRYILSPINRILHLQLIEPERVHIPVFSVTDPSLNKRTRLVLIVKEPHELESLMIQIGRTSVFLPWQDNGLYEQLRRDAALATSLSVEMSGYVLAWPTGPNLALDFEWGS